MNYPLLFLAELLEEDYVFLAIGLYGGKFVKHNNSEREKSRRINWCRSKLGWTLHRHWKKVIFSDETQVVVDQNKLMFG